MKRVLDFLNADVKEGYIEDEKLRKRIGVNAAKWKEMVNLPVFESRRLVYFRGDGAKQAVWSSEKGIKKAKETISMARYE